MKDKNKKLEDKLTKESKLLSEEEIDKQLTDEFNKIIDEAENNENYDFKENIGKDDMDIAAVDVDKSETKEENIEKEEEKVIEEKSFRFKELNELTTEELRQYKRIGILPKKEIIK